MVVTPTSVRTKILQIWSNHTRYAQRILDHMVCTDDFFKGSSVGIVMRLFIFDGSFVVYADDGS